MEVNSQIRHWLKLSAYALIVALLLKFILGFDVVNTALIFTGWIFFGHLITIDDDFPGGWSNPFGEHSIPVGALALKGLIFLSVLVLKFFLSAN